MFSARAMRVAPVLRRGLGMLSGVGRVGVRGASSGGVRAASSASGLSKLDASELTVTQTTSPRGMLPLDDLVFGQTFSNHMLEADWTAEQGWGAPRIGPYENFSMPPSALCLHYGLQCFEGLKAYVDAEGRARLFRPEMNMARLNISSQRLAMPSFNEEALLDCIKELVLLDKDFIPDRYGFSLYIRPTMIATQAALGVGPPSRAKVFVITSPVGPYYKTGFAPVTLFADEVHRRAWPGGIGYTKAGGNYAPTIHVQREAAEKGYQQVLWLFGDDNELTEVGTMNMFVHQLTPDGKKELVTPPLGDTILPGVTRASVIELVQAERDDITVVERKITMDEILQSVADNRLIECFGAGTAAIVSPISKIGFRGDDYEVPIVDELQAGELTHWVADRIMSIQYGRTPHEWSVLLE